MTTQYTPTLKLALPVTGELSGTWGDVVNDNITSMIEQAIAGLATINSWTGNAHTLTTANGTTSESRCAMLVAATGGGAPSAAAEIICPAAAKLYVLQNNTSYAVTLKTSAGTGVAVAAGDTAFLFCDGTNVNSCVTTIVNGHITGNLTVDGNATINGNTTLGNATSDTVTVTARVASNVLPSADNTYDLGASANAWKDLYIDGTATMALVAISGGTINGVSIGATTPATFLAVDNLSLNGNTIASTDTNGNIVIAPNGTGDVQLDADTVRVGDSGAAATLTSNGAGALTVTTGGAADLTLSTNSGTTSGTIVIANGAGGNITLTPEGTGDVILAADRVQIGDANTDTTLTTNGTGSLNLTTNNGTNSGTIQIAQGANGNITLTPNGTGSVSVPKFVWSNGTATRVPYLTTGGQFTDSANLTFNGTDLTVSGAVNAGSVNATTLDLTNLEVTNIKAKDGTASITLADSTGVASFSANPVMSGGTAYGVAYLNGSKVLTTGSALTYNGTNLGLGYTADARGGVVLTTTNNSGVNEQGGFQVTNGNSTGLFAGVNGAAFTTGGIGNANNAVLYSIGNTDLIFGRNTAEQMRLTSTGLIAQQGAVFNESGADSDFRVEGDTQTHLLFADASTDRVGIATNAPSQTLDVSGTFQVARSFNSGITLARFYHTTYTGGAQIYDIAHFMSDDAPSLRISEYDTGTAAIVGELTLSGGDANVQVIGSTGALVLGTNRNVGIAGYSLSGERVRLSSSSTVFNENGEDVDFRVESDTNTHALFVDAGNSKVGINWSAPSMALTIGAVSATGAVTNLSQFSGIQLNGNQANVSKTGIGYQDGGGGGAAVMFGRGGSYNTDISFFTNSVSNTSPGGMTERGYMGDNGYFYWYSGAVFNENGDDADFRVESDNNTHMLFVDAGSDVVSIGTSTVPNWYSSDTLQSNTWAVTSLLGADQSGWSTGCYQDAYGYTAGWKFKGNYPATLYAQSGDHAFFVTASTRGAGNAITWREALRLSDGAAVFNEDSNDVDFRVESDTNTHALFVDAGNSRVGIGESNPARTLDVNGIVRVGYALNQSNPVQNTWYDIISAMDANTSYKVSLQAIKASNEEFAMYETLYVIGGLVSNTQTSYYMVGSGAGLEYRIVNNFPSANQMQARVTTTGASALRASVIQMP